jgi:hypothetical protein
LADARSGGVNAGVDRVVVFVAASGGDGVQRQLLGKLLGGSCTCLTGRSGRHGTSQPSNVRFLKYDMFLHLEMSELYKSIDVFEAVRWR